LCDEGEAGGDSLVLERLITGDAHQAIEFYAVVPKGEGAKSVEGS
jgi:hypothetical protein